MTALILHPNFDIGDPLSMAAHPVYGPRPLLRGRLHQVAAIASAPAGLLLVARADSDDARRAALVYAVTWTLMFTTSACYHRLAESVTARFWMRRLDHSMIFVHVAGATTPVALLGTPASVGRALLVISWCGALVGVALKMTQLTVHHDPCPWLFPVLGTLRLLTVPGLFDRFGAAAAAMLISSAVLYGIGAVCFARKSPDPVPHVFGYHEVWHVFTVLGGLCQFVLTLQMSA